MSGSDRLREIVAKLARDVPEYDAGWRAVDAGAAPLSALLAEIDETVLPRQVSVRNDAGQVLLLDLGNRRLFQLVGPAPEGLGALPFDTPLAADDDAVLATLKAGLDAFVGAGGRFWVKSMAGVNAHGTGRTGLSAAFLSKCWDVPIGIPRATPQQAMAAFIEAAKPLAVVWVEIAEGEVADVSAGDPAVAWSQACATVDWSARLPDVDGDGFRLGTFAADPAPDAGCLVVAVLGASVFCALLPATRLDGVMAAWQRSGSG